MYSETTLGAGIKEHVSTLVCVAYDVEIGKVCRDTTTIPHNSSTKREYMRGWVAYIYIY